MRLRSVGVDELAAVVRVDAEQREAEQASRSLKRVHDPVLGLVQKWQTLRPGSGHIGQRERVQKRSFGAATAVRHQVSLQKSWLDVVPLGEGADRDLLLEQPGLALWS